MKLRGTYMASVAEKFTCRSSEEILSFEMNWEIPRSILQPILKQKDGSIVSSKYKIRSYNSPCYLKIEPEYDYKLLKLYLGEVDIKESMIWARWKCIIYQNESNNQDENLQETQFSLWESNLRQAGKNIKNVQYLEQDRYWEGEYIFIKCEVEVKVITNNFTITSTIQLSPPINKLNSNLVTPEPLELPSDSSSQTDKPQKTNNASLLVSGRFADVAFKVGVKIFKAHRTILVVQSEYFDTMFNSSWNESEDCDCIEVTDVEPEIFEAFLK